MLGLLTKLSSCSLRLSKKLKNITRPALDGELFKYRKLYLERVTIFSRNDLRFLNEIRHHK